MKAKIRNIRTGAVIDVHSTTTHPDCSYGQAIWVDKNNNAYFQVGLKNPFYEVIQEKK